MKTFKLVVIFALLLFYSTASISRVDSLKIQQEQQEVQDSFKQVVKRFVDFFQEKQKLVYKFTNDRSKTGVAFYLVEYTCSKINYSLNSTNSEKNPYQGKITFNLKKRDNSVCGTVPNITALGYPVGWETIEAALANDNELCYRKNVKKGERKVEVRFDFNGGKWEIRDVRYVGNNEPEMELSAVFEIPVAPGVTPTEEAAVQFNKKWMLLVR